MMFETLLNQFVETPILVVGDVMLDEYIWGEVRRISPEAPVPVVEAQKRTYVPGGASNVATNVVSLGGRAWLAGVVGRDEQATQLERILTEREVRVEGLLTDEARPTTTKSRIIAHSQQIARVDSEQRAPLSEALENELLAWAEEKLRSVRACVLSDYNKGVVTPSFAQRFIALAQRAGRPVIVDPKGTDYEKYRGATVLKPNIRELEQVMGREASDEETLREAANALQERLEGAALLVSRGDQGMSLFRSGLPPFRVPPILRAVYDVTGAGDTVVSALALTLGAGGDLESAAHLANRAASLVVGKLGTASVTLDELRHDLHAANERQA